MQELGDLFKTLVFDKIVKKWILRILAKSKFLSLGPVAYIITTILTKLADALYAALDEFIDFKAIAFKNKALEAKLTEAEIDLYSAANQYGVESPEFIEKRKANDEAFYEFIEMGDTAA